MVILIISSEKDSDLSLQMLKHLEEGDCEASIFFPDTPGDATLPAHTLRIMQTADYFIYLVTKHSQEAGWITGLVPENVAPLCPSGVKVVLIVSNGGSLPPELAYLPSLYFLDDEILPVLIEGFVQSLHMIEAIGPGELYHLRYGARDLEAFLETAQGVSMAYSGIESAWDEITEHDDDHARALFERFSSDVSFGINFTSRLRLETRASQQPENAGSILALLDEYKLLERDWHALTVDFTSSEKIRAYLLAARCRAAAFVNLLYLVMALRLQPYCDQYLHLQGLKHKQEMHYSTAQTENGPVERLSFLMATAKKSR